MARLQGVSRCLEDVQHRLWHVGDMIRDPFAQEEHGKVIRKVVAVMSP
jgi:hypothetical protein